MGFFLIFLVSSFIAGTAILGVSYLYSFYYVYFVLKILKISIEFRLKKSDNVNFLFVFIYTACLVFFKEIFLYYYFYGKFVHSEEQMIHKLFIFSIISLFVLSANFQIVEFLYKNDVIRTIICLGYGLSDTLALNWITREFLKGTISEWNYMFLMSAINCIPGFFVVLKEVFTFDMHNIIYALKEIRNTVIVSMILAGINLCVLDYFKKIESNYVLVCYMWINSIGLILFFSYKSFVFGNTYEEKMESIRVKKNNDKKIKKKDE